MQPVQLKLGCKLTKRAHKAREPES